MAVKTNVDFEVAYISDTKRTRETFDTLKLAGKMPPPENCIYTPIIREKCQGIYTMQDFKFFPVQTNNYKRMIQIIENSFQKKAKVGTMFQ